MTVLENVGYGLMVKGVPRQKRDQEAEKALALVALPGFGGGGRRSFRRPAATRALARALVNQPKVLLLDEPLGALDLKLREQMQVELKTLQRNLGITFVFVTHDHGEALSMADRVAIFNEARSFRWNARGHLRSVPKQPASPPTSSARPTCSRRPSRNRPRARALASLRPEKIGILRAAAAARTESSFDVTVKAVHYQGAVTPLNTLTREGIAAQRIAPPIWAASARARRWCCTGHPRHCM